MATLETKLRQAQDVMDRRGDAYDFGCSPKALKSMIAVAKERYPSRPYCAVADWIWVDILAPQDHREQSARSSISPSFIFVAQVLEDEACRPHIGPMVRTSVLQSFEENCLFVTANTVYVLCGRGKRTAVLPEVANSITF